MDKYLGMVADRLEVGDGDPTPLEKYRPAGGYGEAGSGVDVAQVQYRPSGAMQGNPGQGGGLTRTHPDHFSGDHESDCYKQWQIDRDLATKGYDKCRKTPGWTCSNPKDDPNMDYGNYRRDRCLLK